MGVSICLGVSINSEICIYIQESNITVYLIIWENILRYIVDRGQRNCVQILFTDIHINIYIKQFVIENNHNNEHKQLQ